MSLFPRITTWVSNQVLTAAALNGEFNNILNNAQASSWVGYSANVAQMQQQTTPGGVGSENLAGSISDELQRLRFQLARIQGTTYWYDQTGGNFGPGAITSTMLANQAVTAPKIANNAVGPQQLATFNYALSAQTTASTVYVSTGAHGAITAISQTLTVSGLRPVMVMLMGGTYNITGQTPGTGAAPSYSLNSSSGAGTVYNPNLSTIYATTTVGGSGEYQNPNDVLLNAATAGTNLTYTYTLPAGGLNLIDFPSSAGTYTYTLTISPTLRSGTNGITNVQLLCYEVF